jgi:hypothetical protein
MFYTCACPRRSIGTSLGLDRDENSYLGFYSFLLQDQSTEGDKIERHVMPTRPSGVGQVSTGVTSMLSDPTDATVMEGIHVEDVPTTEETSVLSNSTEDLTMEVTHVEEVPSVEETPNTEDSQSLQEELSNTTETSMTRRQSSRTPVFSEKFLELRKSLSKDKANKIISFGMEVASRSVIGKTEPKNYKEAMMKSEEAKQWKSAIEDEYQSLITNNTWALVERPAERNIVGCKWAFKVKPGYTGVAERYKARLVAKGITQCYGTDFNQWFSNITHFALF